MMWHEYRWCAFLFLSVKHGWWNPVPLAISRGIGADLKSLSAAALDALEVSVELPGREFAGGWVLGVAYVISSLCLLGRCSEA